MSVEDYLRTSGPRDTLRTLTAPSGAKDCKMFSTDTAERAAKKAGKVTFRVINST